MPLLASPQPLDLGQGMARDALWMLKLPKAFSYCFQGPRVARGHILLKWWSSKSLLGTALGTAIRLGKAGYILCGAIEGPKRSRPRTRGSGVWNSVASYCSPSGCGGLVLGSCQTPRVAT